MSNVYYDSKGVYYLKLRGLKKRFLILQPQIRINLTNILPQTTALTPFIKVLRKKLRNTKILQINQHEFDRIVSIEFNNNSRLICEILPRGSLVLTDNEGKIIAADHYIKMRDRTILPNAQYKFPPNPPKNPSILDDNEILKTITSRTTIIRGLLNLGLGFKYSAEICFRLRINCNTKVNKLDSSTLSEIIKTIKTLINEIENSRIGYLYLNAKNMPIAFSPIKLGTLSPYEHKSLETFDDAIDAYFSLKSIHTKQPDTTIMTKKTKLEKILGFQEQQIASLEKKIKRLNNIAELLFENYRIIDNILKIIQDAKDNKKLTWQEIKSRINEGKKLGIEEASIINDIKDDGTVELKIDSYTIHINYRDTINSYVQNIYQKIKKLETKLQRAKEERTKTLKQLYELKEILEKELALDEWIIKEPKREWYHGFRWFFTSNGFLVVAGRDAQTNEILLKKYATSKDVILHADIPGGAVVILRNSIKASDQDLFEAAIYAASYSKAWLYGYSAIDVFTTTLENISFTPPSGTYLKRGSFIVRRRLKELKNVPLHLAIGLKITIEKPFIYATILSAPPQAIERLCDFYIKIRPGAEDKNSIASKIVHAFKNYVLEKLKLRIRKSTLNMLIQQERVIDLIPGPSIISGEIADDKSRI